MQRCTRVDVFIYKINFLGGSRCGAAFSPLPDLVVCKGQKGRSDSFRLQAVFDMMIVARIRKHGYAKNR